MLAGGVFLFISLRAGDVASRQAADGGALQAAAQAPPRPALQKLGAEIAFEPRGKAFVARGRGFDLAVGAAGATMAFDRGALRSRLVGAADAAPRAEKRLPGVVNRYTETSTAEGLPTYGRVRYDRVYPGVDLVYHGARGALEYDFEVVPGADPGRIALALSGARSLRIAANGDLVADMGGRTLRQKRPVAWNVTPAGRKPVEARFVLDGNRVRFALGRRDRSQPLVIDPVLAFGDFIGSSGADYGSGIAVDGERNIYVTGSTDSTSIPGTTGTKSVAGTNAYVIKIAPDGTRRWITYLGGGSGRGIAVDAAGNPTVVGDTSGGFVATTGMDTTLGGTDDAFIARLSSGDGSRIWATYWGGSGNESGVGIAVDGSGNSYVGGSTTSAGIASVGDTSFGGVQDGFVTKYAPSGAWQWNTYVGASGGEYVKGVAIRPGCSSDCDMHLTGPTNSTDFYATNWDTSYGGNGDAFVVKLSSNGATRLWSTYYGGSLNDSPQGIAVDADGYPAITGWMSPIYDDNDDNQIFIAAWYIGWEGYLTSFERTYGAAHTFEGANAIAADDKGNYWIAGSTATTNLDTAGGPYRSYNGGINDGFVMKVNRNSPGGFPLVWGTYLGGAAHENVTALALDDAGGIYLTGYTNSGDFPTKGQTQDESTPWDAFVTRLQLSPVSVQSGPEGRLRTRDASFTYSSSEHGARYECRLVPAEADFVPCSVNGKSYSGLADGEYTFEVRVFDPGNTTDGKVATRAFRVDTSPDVSLAIAPNPVLVGRAVTFDGSGSSGADQPIVKYEWDLDGDGTYERDTASTPSTTQTYATPGARQVGLRVTDGAGRSAVALAELRVNSLTSAAGQFGVTINNGAQYTRTPDVKVTASFPAATTAMLFSNDGGFIKPGQFAPAKETKWKLDSSGPERLPKTIYVRFMSGGVAGETFQDDIILDETPPKVQEASVSGSAGAASASSAAVRRWTVKVKAKDSNSGVAKLQVTSNKRKPGKALAYKRKLKVKSAKRPAWVRARDTAGNWSRWRRAR